MPETASSAGGTANGPAGGIETMKDTYIPIFNNRPEDYKEWRQRITLYRKKLLLQNKEKEAVVNLLTSLQGLAWRQVERNVDKLMEDDQGFSKTLDLLDQAFKYDSRVEMPRALEKFFYATSRRGEQTLLSYVSDHREALREVEKHGIKIPENVSGWLLLRRSGLTTEQKQLIQSRCGDLKDYEVEQALYYLLGQDYKTKMMNPSKGIGRHGSRWNRAGHHGYYMDEEAYQLEDDGDGADYDEEYFYEDEEHYEAVDDEAYEETYYQDGSYFETEEYEGTSDGDPQLEEAYATYLDARRQFANLKAARGYYPVVALAPGIGNDQASMSPSSQGPRPPKGKGKGFGSRRPKGKGKGKKGGYVAQKGSAKSRASSFLDQKCLRCGSTDHMTSACPKSSHAGRSSNQSSSPAKRQKSDGHGLMVKDENVLEPLGIPKMSEQGCFGIQDGGASSVVVGDNVLMQFIDLMYLRGVPPEKFKFLATNKTFGFGGDARRQSDWSCRLPVWIEGKHGFMECFIVEGNTPLLVGRPLLKALEIHMNYTTSQFSALGSPWKPLTIGGKGEYLLRLDDGIGGRDVMMDHILFDYVTDDSLDVLQNLDDISTYISLEEYLSTTLREPPERALTAAECGEEETLEEPTPEDELYTPTSEIQYDDPTAVRREITSKLIKTLHMHFAHLGKRRNQLVEQALTAYTHRRKTFWEVYSGEAGLAQVMLEFGWNVRTFDTLNGWDFEKPSHRRRFFELQDEECPDVVWWAPPCTVWSPMQNLNTLTEESKIAIEAARDYEEHVHLKFVRRGYKKQLHEGRHSGIENPAHSKAWQTMTFRDLPGYPSYVDQCAYGAVLPDENGVPTPIKKPTYFHFTSEQMAIALERTCDGSHYHLPIEGSSPGVGNRAKASGAYQEPLCVAIAEAWDELYSEPTVDKHYMADEDENVYVGEGEEGEEEYGGQPYDDDELDYEPSIAPAEEAPHEPEPPEPRGVLYRLTSIRQQEVKRTLLRLHRNLGHPTNAELARILESKNASPELVEAARIHECPVCHQHQRPSSVPVSSMPKTTTFNERVQADTLWVVPPGNIRAVPILMMSDSMTRLISARLLATEDSEEFIKSVEKGWIRSFGPMKVLQVDEHRAWSSEKVRSWCSENGIELSISPGQSHPRLAILERRHQVTRKALTL